MSPRARRDKSAANSKPSGPPALLDVRMGQRLRSLDQGIATRFRDARQPNLKGGRRA